MENFEQKEKQRKIIGWIVIAVLASLAVAFIVGNIVSYGFNFATISSIFFVFMVCGILCFIAYISCIKGMFVAAAKAQQEEKFYFNKKNFLLGLLLFVACAAASSPLWVLSMKEINKTYSSNYVKTEAIVTSINYGDSSGLKYLYFDEDGNEIIANNGASFGGIAFKEGKTVTIYYNKNNPQIIVNLGTAALEICGALFFMFGGLIAFFANMGLNKIIPVFFCLAFICFSVGMIIGTILSSGLNLWEVFTGGVLGFACTVFALIGLALMIPSIIDLIKLIINFIKNKDERKQERAMRKELKSYENEINAKYFNTPTEKKVKKRKPRIKYKHRFCKEMLIFIFVGIIFSGAGGLMFSLGVRELIIESAYVKCEATITDIRLFEKEGDLLGSAIYTYTVNGVEYTQESTYAQSAELLPEVGKIVTIRYNKNNPTDIKDGNWISFVELFFSLIPIGIGVGMFVWAARISRVHPSSIRNKNEKSKKTIETQ